MKKTLKTLLLVISLLLVGQISVFAASDGKITITNADNGKTYKIYEILHLESYDEAKGAYVYKTTSAWDTFVKAQTTYFSVDAQGYVTWVSGAKAEDLAKVAIEYAKTNSITPTATKTASSTGSLVFDKLDLGYYLVDSTMGTICGLTTTHKEASIQEKNTPPTIDKLVKEDSNNQYGKTNTAEIDDTIDYKITINAKKGAENYVLTDTMTAGLTLDQTSIVVAVNGTTLTKDTHYTLTTTEHSFVITFKNDYLKTITADTAIIVTYQAKLNENAIVGKVADTADGNDNKVVLAYGESHETKYDKTRTYTFCFDLVKTDKSNIVLKGAEFKLLDKDGNEIKVVKVEENIYRVAKEGETGVVIEAGDVRIKGLDTDTYYLRETKAPEGFTKLASDVTVTIQDSDKVAVVQPHENEVDSRYVSGGVHVVNTKGELMPETGSFGTFMFILVGSITVLACGILLVTKFRMSKISA